MKQTDEEADFLEIEFLKLTYDKALICKINFLKLKFVS